MKINKLSIVIPTYNEEATIKTILEKINEVELMNNIKKEIIIVNDCSQDSTKDIVSLFIKKNPNVEIHYFEHKVNKGKGAAIRTAISHVKGECFIIQDADLEYEPKEYNDLLQPMVLGYADIVYGSRFTGSNPHRILFFWHTIGNKFLTFLSNIFTNLNLTDMETCYKLFSTEKIRSIKLRENRFGFEPEITAKISQIPKIRIYEVGISYFGRTYEEGKKINWKDGFAALFCIVKYGALKMK